MTTYFLDPSAYATEAAPTGTSDKWDATDYAASVTTQRGVPTSCFKDRVFTLSTTSASTDFHARSLDSIEAKATCEVLTAFRFTFNVQEAQIVVRGGGSTGTETGYAFIAANSGDTVTIYEMNVGNVASASYTMAIDTWYWMRCYASGSDLKLRIWADGETEPSTWNVSGTDASVTADGWIGYHMTAAGSASTVQFAFFSIGTSGDAAPTPVSRAAYAAWLDRGGERRALLAEIRYHDSTEQTLYLANALYQSRAYDTPASQRYDEAILEGPSNSTTVANPLGGRIDTSIGTLLVDNVNGTRDSWLKANFDGRQVTVLVGDPSWARCSFRQLLTGVTEFVRNVGLARIEFVLRDSGRLADRAVQENTIGSGDNTDRLKPLVVGNVRWVDPIPIDNATLEYQLHDGSVYSIGDAYDNAVVLQSSPTISGVDTGTDVITTSADHGFLDGYELIFGANPPAPLVQGTVYYVRDKTNTTFKVAATSGGAAIDLTTTGTSPTVTGYGRQAYLSTGKINLLALPAGELRIGEVKLQATNTIAANVRWLAENKLGLTGSLDPVAFSAAATAIADETGVFLTERANALDVFDRLVTQAPMLWGFDRGGLLYLETLVYDLSGYSARLALTTDNLYEPPALEGILMPVDSFRVLSRRNSDPSTQFATSVTNTDRDIYARSHQSIVLSTHAALTDDATNHTLRVREWVLETEMQEATAEDLSQYWVNWRSAKVGIWRATTTLAALELRLGDVVSLTYPRWGFDSGVKAQVIGLRDDVSRERVAVTLVVPAYGSATL